MAQRIIIPTMGPSNSPKLWELPKSASEVVIMTVSWSINTLAVAKLVPHQLHRRKILKIYSPPQVEYGIYGDLIIVSGGL